MTASYSFLDMIQATWDSSRNHTTSLLGVKTFNLYGFTIDKSPVPEAHDIFGWNFGRTSFLCFFSLCLVYLIYFDVWKYYFKTFGEKPIMVCICPYYQILFQYLQAEYFHYLSLIQCKVINKLKAALVVNVCPFYWVYVRAFTSLT